MSAAARLAQAREIRTSYVALRAAVEQAHGEFPTGCARVTLGAMTDMLADFEHEVDGLDDELKP